MKKYVAIYHASLAKLEEWATTPPDERQSGMEAWQDWADRHKDAIVEMGAPLGKSLRVTTTGVENVRNEICGYTIVEGESHQEAAAVFLDNPHVAEDDTWIDVLEWVDMPA